MAADNDDFSVREVLLAAIIGALVGGLVVTFRDPVWTKIRALAVAKRMDQILRDLND